MSNFDDRFSGLPVEQQDVPPIDVSSPVQATPLPEETPPQIRLVPVKGNPFANYKAASRGIDVAPTAELQPNSRNINRLFGLQGEERYQFFPEKVVRSIGDAMVDPSLSVEKGLGLPSETALEGAFNAAGLAGGAPLATKPGVATLGSGAIRPAIAAKTEIAPPFYSAVEKAVDAILQPKMLGKDWLGTLSNRPGVKPEELGSIGLDRFLSENKDKVLTKADVQGFVKDNQVQVQEVNKGTYHHDNTPLTEEQIKEYHDISDEKWNKLSEQQQERYKEIANEGVAKMDQDMGATKYQSYQLPGGENYREKLFTLPSEMQKYNDFTKELRTKYGEGGFNNLPLTKDERLKLDRLQESAGDEGPKPYTSSHWDEPNVLAHVRMNDRTIEGQKSLHIEEIQSDWHQAGRDQGYRTSQSFEEAEKKYNQALKSGDKELADKYYLDLINKKYEKGVPDAPFKKSWHELVLKRAIREAAEKGYAKLSWTPGEAQAARYDLSKQVDSVHYNPDTQRLVAKKGNANLIDEQSIKPADLEKYIGKDVAKKLMEQEPNVNGLRSLHGEGLKVGGEGMKGFYDKIIPKAIERITGEKVKTDHLPFSDIAAQDLRRKIKDTTKPDEIASAKYGPEWDKLVKDKRLIEQQNADTTLKQSSIYKRAGLARINQIEDELSKLHDKMINETVDRIVKNTKGQPIHYIDITPALRQKALRQGFPLFSSGVPVFTPVQGNPHDK